MEPLNCWEVFAFLFGIVKHMNITNIKNLLRKHWKLILAIIYLVSPIDFIPDVLLPLGYTEDIILLVTVVLDYFVQKKKKAKQKEDIVDGEIVE